MESNNKLIKINTKNRTCNCFDDMIKIEGFDLDNILIHKKSKYFSENILVYNISHKKFDTY